MESDFQAVQVQTDLKCVICYTILSREVKNETETGKEFSESESKQLLELFCKSLDVSYDSFSNTRIFCPGCHLTLVKLRDLTIQIEELLQQTSRLIAGISVKIVESSEDTTSETGKKQKEDSLVKNESVFEINHARRLIKRRYDAKVLVDAPLGDVHVQGRLGLFAGAVEEVYYPLVEVYTSDNDGNEKLEDDLSDALFDPCDEDSSTSLTEKDMRRRIKLPVSVKSYGGKTRRKTGSKHDGQGSENFGLENYVYRMIGDKFQCGSCGRVFGSINWWRRHVRENHVKGNPSRTYFRLVEVSPNKYLYANKFAVSRVGLKFRCCTCKRSFNGSKRITNHIRLRHLNSSMVPPTEVEDKDKDKEEVGGKDGVDQEVSDPDAFAVFDAAMASLGGSSSRRSGPEKESEEEEEVKPINAKQYEETSPGNFIYGGEYKFVKFGDQYRCETCGRTKSAKKYMISHVRRIHFHKRGKERKKIFLNVEEVEPNKFLYANSVTVSFIGGNYVCGSCEHSSKTKYKAFDHIRAKHLSLYPGTVCDVCGKSFRNRSYFLKHCRLHTEVRKSYTCHTCGKSFACEQYLMNHVRIHEGDDAKRYQCEFCGKKFFTSQKLSGHVALHTGEKNFECPCCHSKFKSYNIMSAHRKICREKYSIQGTSQLQPTGVQPNRSLVPL